VGASILLPHEAFTAEALRQHLVTLFTSPQRLEAMAKAAREAGHPDAAARLADIVVGVMTGSAPQ